MLTLFRQRNYRLLWTGGFISETGDWLLAIGLPLAVFFLTGSALVTSLVFIIEMVPLLLFGSLAGVLVDRWDRRRTLIIVNVLQALGLIPLAFIHSQADLWLVYLVSVFESTLSLLTLPAQNALIPSLVEESQVLQANSLTALGAGLSRLIGSPLGGLVVGFWGLQGIVVIDAASFILSALLIAGLRTPQQATTLAKNASAGLFSEWRDGLSIVIHSRQLSVLFLVISVQALAQGIFLVLYIIFVLSVLHGTSTDVGLLRGVQAIGSLVGGIIIGTLGQRTPFVWLIGGGSILFGLLDLAIWNSPAIYPSFAITVVLFILVGIPGVGIGAGAATCLQTWVPDAFRGRVFGVYNTLNSLLLIVGFAIAGWLGDRVGLMPILNGQGALYIVAGLIALLFLGGARKRRW